MARVNPDSADGHPHHYCKRLEGIQCSPRLETLLKQAVQSPKSTTNSGFLTIPQGDAVQVIQDYLNQRDRGEACHGAIPLNVIRAAASLCVDDPAALSEAVRSRSLVYTKPPPPPVPDARFQRRMDRLRLHAEEASYQKLTNNLDSTVQDDVTVKSMTYAASVGLNMIVAPITFGVFMYFFAGQVFSFMGVRSAQPLRPHETDITRVIAGVVSGVAMLFIEMILFVIRTHTMDASMRKKQKRTHISPFGYSKPTMEQYEKDQASRKQR